jgi:hypothetical protein
MPPRCQGTVEEALIECEGIVREALRRQGQLSDSESEVHRETPHSEGSVRETLIP